MYCELMSSCCGILELQGFHYDAEKLTVEVIKREIKESIIYYSCNRYDFYKEIPPHIYDFYIATTDSKQLTAAQALKELGFRQQPGLKSSHNDGSTFTFWYKKGTLPGIKREVMKDWNEWKRENEE